MRTLYLLPALLLLACATTPVHPSVVTMSADAVPAFVPDCYVSPEGAYLCDHMAAASGVSVSPRGASLTSLLEGQAQPPVGTPSYAEQAFSLTLNAPSGSVAESIKTGAKICLDTPCTISMSSDTSFVTFTGNISSASAGFISNRSSGNNAYAVGVNGGRIDVGTGTNDFLDSDGTTIRFGGGSGNLNATVAEVGAVRSNAAGASAKIEGRVTDSASAVSVIADTNGVTYATAGAKLLSVRNNGTEKANFTKDGDLTAAWGIFSGSVTAGSPTKATISGVNGKITLDATDSTGTPGAATVNKPSGQVAVAAASNSVVVTNSLVTTSSVVFAVLQVSDGTCSRVQKVIVAAGSFTIAMDANCTAAAKVGWVVFN